MIGVHLKKNILPGYACYKALINSEIDKKIAIDFVERLMCDSAQRMARLCKTDHIAYDPLAPSVVFVRNGTLAKTGIKCDFCFRKGRI